MNPNWKVRRTIIISTLLFCAGIVIKIVWSGTDNPTTQVVLYCNYGLAASVIGSYVFGAVWDDKTKKKG